MKSESSSAEARKAARPDPLKKKSSARTNASKKSSASTSKADILISIKPIHMNRISARTKNHEFRKYLIPNAVKRMWLYVSSPDQTLRYIATISHGKKPGEVEDEDGIGNADFNAGLKESGFAYEVKELYELQQPIPLKDMQDKYGATFPQRYTYVLEAMIQDVVLDQQIRLF